MKNIISLFMIILSYSAFAQNDKSEEGIDYSGEYSGIFTDINNASGTLELFLYQSDRGRTSGIIVLNRIVNGENVVTTGTITISANENILSGHFIPSEINYVKQREVEHDNLLSSYDSYSCRWEIFGEIKDKNGNTIIGKAVPTNCIESNLIEFAIEKK